MRIMKKKITFQQMSLIFDPIEPNHFIIIMELENGKAVGYYSVKVPKIFQEFKMNPFLLN